MPWEVARPDGTPIAGFEPQPEAGRAFGPLAAPPRHDQLLRTAS